MAKLPSGIPQRKPKYPEDNIVEADEVPIPPFLISGTDVTADLDGLQKDVIDAANEIHGWVEDRLADMDRELTPIQAEISGHVDLMLNEMSERIGKAATPIMKWIDSKMDEMYQHAADGGIPSMSDEGFVMAKGDETGYVLPYNYIRMYGDGKPFTVNWPTELLGPDPFAESSASQGNQGFGSQTGTPPGEVLASLSGTLQANAPIAGDGLPIVDVSGNGGGICPTGQVLVTMPDGSQQCWPQEFANPCALNPNDPACNPTPPPTNPPIVTPPPVNPPTGGSMPGCSEATVQHVDQGDNTLRNVDVWPKGVISGPHNWNRGVMDRGNGRFNEVVHCPIGYVPGYGMPVDGPGVDPYPIAMCVPTTCGTDTPPPTDTTPPTSPPTDTCPIPKPKLKCKPGDILFDCVQKTDKELMDKWSRDRELPPDLQAEINASDGMIGTVSGIIWQYSIRKCSSEKGIPIDKDMDNLCGFSDVKPINWCKENVSTDLDSFMFGLPKTSDDFAKLFCVWQFADGSWYPNGITKWLYDASLVPGWIPDSINGALHIVLSSLWGIVEKLSDPANPKSKASLAADGITTLFEALNKWIGFPPMTWIKRMRYTANAMNPVEIPSAAEVGQLFQTGLIDVPTFQNLMGAHDLCPDWMLKVADANRTRPDAFQTIDGWRRGIYGENTRDLRLRQLGVLNEADKDVLIRLSESLPGMSDLISFMVKDAFDKDLVKEWKLDDEFDIKWTGEAQRLGNAQGISRDTALIYWLAHWQNISPTQLYQMVGRLRPGRVPKSIEVTRETALRVLGINDYVPYWRERLLAIAEHPLNLSDLQQAYYSGTLKDQEFIDGLLDLLYNPRDIDILMRRYRREKLRRQRYIAGLPTPKEIIQSYVDGFIGAEEAIDQLGEFDWEPNQIKDAIAGADRKREQNVRKATIRSVKKRYIKRRLDKPEAIGELINARLSIDAINYLLRLWDSDRFTTQKFIPAGQLCSLWERGLITTDDYVDGLSRLGYDSGSISAITNQCSLKRDDKRVKDVEKRLKEEEARKEKAKKAAEKLAKDLKKEQDAINKKKEACIPKKKRCEALGVPQDDGGDAKSEDK